MNKKNENKEVETSKSNKKRNIILIVVGLILLIIILILLWFFNRKFEVTFDFNNGTKEEVVLVKYNKTIDEEDVKTKEDLGEQFINWYLVIKEEDGKEVLSEKPFDFKTKINEKTKLKAVYEGKVETVTVTFDSKGGTNVESIILNKGAELTLPTNPTYKGYTFEGWVDANNNPISNKTVINEDKTLYANWKKVEEPKKTEPKKEEPKVEPTPEEPKKEKISLKISNIYLNKNSITSTKATASVENPSGNVTYSVNSDMCVSIDSATGDIKLKTNLSDRNERVCSTSKEIVVTATLPSGKSASQKFYIEKNLVISFNDRTFTQGTDNRFAHNTDGTFELVANQDVTWSVSGAISDDSTYNKTTYKGKAINKGNGDVFITATTKSGQKVEMYTKFFGN